MPVKKKSLTIIVPSDELNTNSTDQAQPVVDASRQTRDGTDHNPATGTENNQPDAGCITGTPGDDVLSGTAGDDRFVGHGGFDSISGGAGNDTFVYNQDAAAEFMGGDGTDTVVLPGKASDYLLERYGMDSYSLFNLTDDTFGHVVTVGVERVVFSDGSQLKLDLTPSSLGTSGNDNMFAGAEGSTIHGLDGWDVIHGSTGHDVMYGGNGDDVIFAFGGNDAAYGGDGNDQLLGDAGSTLDGGDGSDILSGNGAVMTGGAGQDRFSIELLTAPGKSNVIMDFAASDETLVVHNFTGAAAAWDAYQDGSDAIIESNGVVQVVLKGVNAHALNDGNIFIY